LAKSIIIKKETNVIYNNILETIGSTPVVRINRLAPDGVEMFVKVESFNPMASVKDRLAIGIIEDAERKGLLKPGQTVIEATSGNTGIALAMVCAVKGYPFVAVMAESFSIERRKLMRALGARVVLTPAAERATGMLRVTAALAEKHGWFMTEQFHNPANPEYHRNTTGPEIIRDFVGRRLDYYVSGWGTGGTISGTGDILKRARPEVQVIATEPEGAAMLGGAEWAPHKIQGWTPDLIPSVLDREVIEEGIFCGISAGGTFAAALKVAARTESGSAILAMLPDTGERYLSTPLFEGVKEGGDDELLEDL
jgi:cysteine synthase A